MQISKEALMWCGWVILAILAGSILKYLFPPRKQ